MTVRLFHNLDSLPDAPLPLGGLRMLRSMGVSTAYLSVYFATLFEDPAKPAWDVVDENILNCWKAGFRIWPHLVWLPRAFTGGVPMLERFGTWTAAPPDPRDGPPVYTWGGFRELKQREMPAAYERESLVFDTAGITDACAQFVKRYRGYIEAAAFHNEPDIKVSHPWKDLFRSYMDAMRWYYETLLIPAYRGFKSADPNILIAGPDTAYAGTTEQFLQLEQERVRKFGIKTERLQFDILTFHVYPIDELLCKCGGRIRDAVHGPSGSGVIFDTPSKYEPHEYVEMSYVERSVYKLADNWGVMQRNGASDRLSVATEFADKMDSPTPELCKSFMGYAEANGMPLIGVAPYLGARYIEGGEAAWKAGRFRSNATHGEMRKLFVPEWARKQRVVRS